MALQGWEYAVSARGEAYIIRENRKLQLGLEAAVKMESAMKRVAAGTAGPGEASLVRKNVSEMRFQSDNRWYRLLYGRKNGKYVALLLLAKKQNKLDNSAIKLAEKRYQQH